MDELLGSLAVAAIFSKFAAFALIITLILTAAVMSGVVIGENSVNEGALRRGYMEYCKADGRLSWVGEC